MSISCKTCHGQFECLKSSSTKNFMSPLFKVHQKIHSFIVWHLENLGLWGMLKYAFLRTGKAYTPRNRQDALQQSELKTMTDNKKLSPDLDVLNLEPGELVEVKPVEEILALLDKNRRYKGLLWMTGMRKFCGKRYRVLKRVEKILLESNGELRKMRNTVLLEGVVCDGDEFSGCDRACFHFWREAWLKRVTE
jgi:hypothetical protein